MEIQTRPTRQLSMDALRIWSSLMVVVLHVASQEWYNLEATSGEWRALNLYDSAVRSCVALFFMISGALFLGRELSPPLPKLLKNHVGKLLAVYLWWALLYGAVTLGRSALTGGAGLRDLLSAAFLQPKYHLWFLPVMMGIYLLLPLLHAMVRYEGGKLLPYACTLFFVFGVLVRTALLEPAQSTVLPQLLTRVPYELAGYSGYFLWGYFLSRVDPAKLRLRVMVPLLLSIIGLSSWLGAQYSAAQGRAVPLLYGDMTLPVFAEAVLFFLIARRLEPLLARLEGGLGGRALPRISLCTMTIYLLHPFVLEQLKSRLGLYTLSFSPWLSVPTLSVLIFLICLAVGLVLTRLPVVGRWLV